MKKITLLIIALCIAGCYKGSPAFESVMKHKDHEPGRFIDGQCEVFAHALQKDMAADGIPTKLITFDVKTQGEFDEVGVRHQVLAYVVNQDIYFMDNTVTGPVWVGSTDDLLMDCIAQFYKGSWVSVSNVKVE